MAKTDGKTCQDINECALQPDICEGGVCVNLEGSFQCTCPDGLTLDSSGNDDCLLMINGFLNCFFDHSQIKVKKPENPFKRFGNHFLEKDFLE